MNWITLGDRAKDFCALLERAEYTDSVGQAAGVNEGVAQVSNLLHEARRQGSNVYLIGNGGSAAIASHVANDFCNVAHLRAEAMLDHAVLTCFANDYGYDKVYSEQLRRVARSGDVLVAISSSGNSENIVAAAGEMHARGGRVVTLTGFRGDNRLRSQGEANFWLDAEHYGLVEVGHLFMLHHLVDQIRLTWAEEDE